MMPFCNLSTRSRFCLAGFAAFCFSSAPACAELTEREMINAIYMGTSQALYDWQSLGQIFAPDVINSFPVDENNASLSYYFSPDGIPENAYLATIISLLPSLSSTSSWDRLFPFLSAVTNEQRATQSFLYDSSSEGSSYTIGDSLGLIQRSLQHVDYRFDNHGYELLVAAPDLESGLESLESGQYSTLYTLDGIYSLLESINSSSNIIEYLDEDPSDTEQDAQEDAEDSDQDADDSVDDTSDNYEYEMPELEEPDEPHTATASDSSGLEDISLNVPHSALITLTRGNASHTPSSPFLPAMEIDLMTTPGAWNFISQLSTLIRYGWDAIFAFLGFCLYYSTFRRIRHMLIATRAGGVPSGEPFSIHYDPF